MIKKPSPGGNFLNLSKRIEKIKPYLLVFSFFLTIISIFLKLYNIIDLTFFSYFYMSILVFWAADFYLMIFKILNFCFNYLVGLRTLRLHEHISTLGGSAFAGNEDKDYGFLRNPRVNVNLSENASSTSGVTGGQNASTPSPAPSSSTSATTSTPTTVVTQQNVTVVPQQNVIRPKFYIYPTAWPEP